MLILLWWNSWAYPVLFCFWVLTIQLQDHLLVCSLIWSQTTLCMLCYRHFNWRRLTSMIFIVWNLIKEGSCAYFEASIHLMSQYTYHGSDLSPLLIIAKKACISIWHRHTLKYQTTYVLHNLFEMILGFSKIFRSNIISEAMLYKINKDCWVTHRH